MNRINPEKLLQSKWTAVPPRNRERHFIVTRVIRDDQDEHVVEVVLQAVLTHRDHVLGWRELKQDDVWQMGWK